jgi:hypothetical protein
MQAMRFALCNEVLASMPIAAARARHGYAGTVAVAPFDCVPDGAGAAAFAAGYWKGVREALA